jgi:hypothetical protein
MPRGRLIYPFVIELYQLDTAATDADPDGVGPLTSGYDEDFREPVKVLSDPDDQLGASARVESGPIYIEVQIEPNMYERLQMMLSGESPESRFVVIAHYDYLERNGLIEAATGRPLIRKNDRLSKILQVNTGTLIEEIPNPPGLFIHQIQSRGFGLGPERNLLLIAFEEREKSAKTA